MPCKFTENTEDTRAFQTNAKVFSGGMDKVQIIDYYNMWNDYEKVRTGFVLRWIHFKLNYKSKNKTFTLVTLLQTLIFLSHWQLTFYRYFCKVKLKYSN